MISCQGGVKGKTLIMSRGGYASSGSLVVKGCQQHSLIMSSGMQVLDQVNFDYMYVRIIFQFFSLKLGFYFNLESVSSPGVI